MDPRRHADATLDNRDELLAVLQRLLPTCVPPGGLVLEVASGTGQHAAFFGPRLPALRWQPTEKDESALASITAWTAHEGATNVLPPLVLDATSERWPVERADAVVCVNMIHISPWESCLGATRGAARVLTPGGLLVLYGPYRVEGALAESNADFDRSLRARDPRWGVREVKDVEAEARRVGLEPVERVEMEWDNLVVVLRRGA
jgi:SAM-dependent methyltransferase